MGQLTRKQILPLPIPKVKETCLILMNGMIYEVNHISNCGCEIKWSYDPRSYECNFSNCVEKLEKFKTSTGFQPVTSRYRCDALVSWAMKPVTLGAGHLWISRDLVQLVRASHRYREVTGSNPVEVLNFSGFFTQLLNCIHNCEHHNFSWLFDFSPFLACRLQVTSKSNVVPSALSI